MTSLTYNLFIISSNLISNQYNIYIWTIYIYIKLSFNRRKCKSNSFFFDHSIHPAYAK